MNHALSIIGKTAILTIPDTEVDEVVVNGVVYSRQKLGFWYTIERGEHGYSAGDWCSVCGEPNHTNWARPKYCGNCGANMRGEQE